MGVSDRRWWVAVVPGLTTTATHWSHKLLPPTHPQLPSPIIVGCGSGGGVDSDSRWWVGVVPGLNHPHLLRKKKVGLKWLKMA